MLTARCASIGHPFDRASGIVGRKLRRSSAHGRYQPERAQRPFPRHRRAPGPDRGAPDGRSQSVGRSLPAPARQAMRGSFGSSTPIGAAVTSGSEGGGRADVSVGVAGGATGVVSSGIGATCTSARPWSKTAGARAIGNSTPSMPRAVGDSGLDGRPPQPLAPAPTDLGTRLHRRPRLSPGWAPALNAPADSIPSRSIRAGFRRDRDSAPST